VWSTDIVVIVAMATLCGTRIGYSRLFVHLGGDLTGSVEEGGCFHGVVDLV
jgi:hypothetical protein